MQPAPEKGVTELQVIDILDQLSNLPPNIPILNKLQRLLEADGRAGGTYLECRSLLKLCLERLPDLVFVVEYLHTFPYWESKRSC